MRLKNMEGALLKGSANETNESLVPTKREVCLMRTRFGIHSLPLQSLMQLTCRYRKYPAMRENIELLGSNQTTIQMLSTSRPRARNKMNEYDDVAEGSSGSESARAIYLGSEPTSWDQCLARTESSAMDYLKSCEWKPRVLTAPYFSESASQWTQVNTVTVPGSEVKSVMTPLNIKPVEVTASPMAISVEAGGQHQKLFKSHNQASAVRNGAVQEAGRTCTILGMNQQPSTSSITKLRSFMFQPKSTDSVELQSASVHANLTTPSTTLNRPEDSNAQFIEVTDADYEHKSVSADGCTQNMDVKAENMRSGGSHWAEETRLDSCDGAASTNIGEDIQVPKPEQGIGDRLGSAALPLSTPASDLELRRESTRMNLPIDLTVMDLNEKALYTSLERQDNSRFNIPSSVIVQVTNNLALHRQCPIKEHSPDIDWHEDLSETPIESDHEFSIDDSEEEKLIQLTDVQERYSPPSDVQFPFDDLPQTPEVYDSNLKGSPPETGNSPVTDNHPSKYFDHQTASLESGVPEGSGVNTNLEGNNREYDCNLAGYDCGDSHEIAPHKRDSPHPSSSVVGIEANGNTSLVDRSAIHRPGPYRFPQSILDCDDSGQPKPFARPPFPAPVQDRPLIPGLSSSTRLRTCFRIGEALREGSMAARNRRNVVIELYARVLYSSREEECFKQNFQFGDLFHDRGPFLNGVCKSWRHSRVWDADTNVFLGRQATDKMARVIGKIERNGASWLMDVMSIWEASWDDVAHVKGIVCS